ncbi:hypothetical protein H6F90_00955 [Trichocoleus sp. FACHB-591]|uniref:hypothetical protein n=1 Tax=Trichocoleus sp. FACHB-591 TaxID=2692872 RepID=UPI0016824B61|nr:hypothetical protein [Trichocoleus sp. FACHB-591]MBD2093725.1 hypothetical protein [Trichocoleus sp. FACHB-591]
MKINWSMLRRFFSSSSLIVIGIVLIAIAFISISFLPSQVESNLSTFFGQLGSGGIDVTTGNIYRRIAADRFLLQSVYFFLTGIVLLIAGLLNLKR